MSKDWFDYAIELESEGTVFTMELSNSMVVLYRSDSDSRVGGFTYEQAFIFFKGLHDRMESIPQFGLQDYVDNLTYLLVSYDIDYMPVKPGMDIEEWACYLEEYAQEYRLM